MADLRGALAAARPVPTRGVGVGGEGGAVGLGAREDVVAVGRIAAAVHDFALLVERVLLAELVVVAVQVGDVLCDHDAFRVVPGAATDAVAGVDGGLAVGGGRAEVGAPGAIAEAGGVGEHLAVAVRAREPSERGTIAGADAGDEEARARRLRERGRCGGEDQGDGGAREPALRHSFLR